MSIGRRAVENTTAVCNGWIGTIRGITVYGHTDGSVSPYYFGEPPSEEQQAADQKELDRIREEIRRDEVKAAIEADAGKANQVTISMATQDTKPTERKEMKYLTSNLWESYQVECPVLSKIPFIGRYAFASFVRGYFEHKKPFSGYEPAQSKDDEPKVEKEQEPKVRKVTKHPPPKDPIVLVAEVKKEGDIEWYVDGLLEGTVLHGCKCRDTRYLRELAQINSVLGDYHEISWLLGGTSKAWVGWSLYANKSSILTDSDFDLVPITRD